MHAAYRCRRWILGTSRKQQASCQAGGNNAGFKGGWAKLFHNLSTYLEYKLLSPASTLAQPVLKSLVEAFNSSVLRRSGRHAQHFKNGLANDFIRDGLHPGIVLPAMVFPEVSGAPLAFVYKWAAAGHQRLHPFR